MAERNTGQGEGASEMGPNFESTCDGDWENSGDSGDDQSFWDESDHGGGEGALVGGGSGDDETLHGDYEGEDSFEDSFVDDGYETGEEDDGYENNGVSIEDSGYHEDEQGEDGPGEMDHDSDSWEDTDEEIEEGEVENENSDEGCIGASGTMGDDSFERELIQELRTGVDALEKALSMLENSLRL
ncbi:MAG: hypothetical protein M1840_001961 [Geoglossum simile]|nr:MAG: hypothetical protein M1840_001961 [Geoglossum simile]